MGMGKEQRVIDREVVSLREESMFVSVLVHAVPDSAHRLMFVPDAVIVGEEIAIAQSSHRSRDAVPRWKAAAVVNMDMMTTTRHA
jgi:hypothetical protein